MSAEFEQYWRRLCLRNPALINESSEMKLTVEAFKRQISKAFLEGAQSELDDLRNSMKEPRSKQPDFIMDAFDSIFGKGRDKK